MGIYARHNDEWYRVDEGGSSGPDLVGGVAGWASIDSVSGTADLTTLKNDGIVPESATEDPDVEGTYNVIENGVEWRVAVFETGSTSNITLSDGVVELLMVGGGGAVGSYGGYGGSVQHGITSTPSGKLDVTVGGPRPDTNDWQGYPTIIEKDGVEVFYCKSGAGNAVGSSNGTGNKGIASSITGVDITYGQSYQRDPVARLGEGANANGSKTGSSGIVVVRSPKDATSNQAPDAPVAWGKFGNVTDYDDTGEWKDGKGRMWKWYEFNTAGDRTIDLTGGMYWVLTVGGGDWGYGTADVHQAMGQPGLVNEGYWEFGNGNTPITVGLASQVANSTSSMGMPSSVGDYGNQGVSDFGYSYRGRGSDHLTTGIETNTGYKSFITGSEREFATGLSGAAVPGRAGRGGSAPLNGCVIIAAVVNEPNDWNQPGALPGIGGWATITDVKGKGNKYSYGDWVAFEWTADGELTTQAGGLVDALVMGSGGYGHQVSGPGSGGFYYCGLTELPQGATEIEVKPGGTVSSLNGGTRLGDRWMQGGSQDRNEGSGRFPSLQDGVKSSITGNEIEYGQNGGRASTTYGSGSPKNVDGQQGVVIVRVPKANYTGDLPDGAFDVPTTRQAVVAALEEKVENVKDTMIIDGRERKIKRNRKR